MGSVNYAGRVAPVSRAVITAGGETYDLNSELINCGNIADVRGFDGTPSVSLGSFAYRPNVRTIDLELTAFGTDGVNTAGMLFNALEAAEGSAALTVTTSVGSVTVGGKTTETGFTQHCGLSKIEVSKTTPKFNMYKLTLVLLDGCWTTSVLNRYVFLPVSGSVPDGIDYPHDYPHDLGMSGNPSRLKQVNRFRTLWPLIEISGPCQAPAVTIAGNKYAVTAPLTAGQTLVIDTLHKTVRLNHGGIGENLLGKAVLGMGEGSGSYIFQPLPVLTGNADGYAVETPTDARVVITLVETVPAINI